MAISLTPRQQEMLDGRQGEIMAKIMKTLVMYGEVFGARRMVDVTSQKGHLVTGFSLSIMKPVYELMDQLIEGGAVSAQQFSVNPRPFDPAIPTSLLQKLLFQFMYSKQKDYEGQLNKLGLMNSEAFTCTCYLDEVGNRPSYGEILSWSESSAVVYANSVLGARCNRNSGIIELFGSIAGCVPQFGLLTDEGRRATWIVKIKTTRKPEAQILGSAIGMKVMEAVPYIKGLDQYLGTELTDEVCAYLKDMGAAAASNGAVGLYHVARLTPEAKEKGESIVIAGARTYEIDDAELERVKNSWPCIWPNPGAAPRLCFIGCPHLSAGQLAEWTDKLTTALTNAGLTRTAIPVVFTAAPAVTRQFAQTPEGQRLASTGAVLSSICPLMFMNNPLCGKMPVITNSNKLRTYSSARFYTEEEILKILTDRHQQA